MNGVRVAAGWVRGHRFIALAALIASPGSVLAQTVGTLIGFLLRSMDLAPRLEFDASVRVIDDLPEPEVSSYVGLDVRLGWHVSDHLSVAVAAFNLLDAQHPETGTQQERNELQRSAYLRADWKF